MGNSEVGHLNLGAGAVVRQDLTRIDDAVADGTLAQNAVLRAAFAGAERVHLIGLVSDGGVHSGWDHIEALIRLGGELGVPDLVVHAFTDGRDTLPKAGEGYLATVEDWLADAAGDGRRRASAASSAATSRWTATSAGTASSRRTTCSSTAAGAHAPRRPEAVRAAYERGETDEFITATTVGDEARIRPGDSVIAFNFRPDRMREITLALADPAFARDRSRRRGAGRALRLHDRVPGGLAVPGRVPARAAEGHALARARRPRRDQLHVAETEKYPHVTYFFNGGEETP